MIEEHANLLDKSDEAVSPEAIEDLRKQVEELKREHEHRNREKLAVVREREQVEELKREHERKIASVPPPSERVKRRRREMRAAVRERNKRRHVRAQRKKNRP